MYLYIPILSNVPFSKGVIILVAAQNTDLNLKMRMSEMQVVI